MSDIPTKALTAEELDAKFDAGEDITEHLDLSTVTRVQLQEHSRTNMRKLIQITSCVRPGADGGAIFIYGLCDDGTAWELYHGDNVLDWSPLPAVPQDEHLPYIPPSEEIPE